MSGPLRNSPSEERVMSAGAGPSSGVSPVGANAACAACKYQRRKCAADCPLAPFFPPDQPKRFLNVHRLFGVSSILRILRQVDPDKREDSVKSIVYEADTREKDPVHGCLGIIHLLQNQVNKLKDELALARDQLYLLEQQHASSILQQNYGHQHPGSQANYHYHLLQSQSQYSPSTSHQGGQSQYSASTSHQGGQSQYSASTSHQGGQSQYSASTSHQGGQSQYNASTSHQGGHGSYHDSAPGHLMTYQDSRAAHATYHDHARYLVDHDSALQEMLRHPVKVESDPYNRSNMGNVGYVSGSGGSLHMPEHHQNQQNLGLEQHQGGSSYALAGDLERRAIYNPLVESHVGRHVDPLRSVAGLQVLDPLNNHSSHVTDPELRSAGVHLSLTNQYSM